MAQSERPHHTHGKTSSTVRPRARPPSQTPITSARRIFKAIAQPVGAHDKGDIQQHRCPGRRAVAPGHEQRSHGEDGGPYEKEVGKSPLHEAHRGLQFLFGLRERLPRERFKCREQRRGNGYGQNGDHGKPGKQQHQRHDRGHSALIFGLVLLFRDAVGARAPAPRLPRLPPACRATCSAG